MLRFVAYDIPSQYKIMMFGTIKQCLSGVGHCFRVVDIC